MDREGRIGGQFKGQGSGARLAVLCVCFLAIVSYLPSAERQEGQINCGWSPARWKDWKRIELQI